MSHPLYHVWRGMLKRCYNVNAHGYANYGGRGIRVCNRWRLDFWAFVADLGERPANTTLDRIDNEKGYEPGNCRWASKKQQRTNSRQNRVLTADGESHTLSEWSNITGIPLSTLFNRIERGWSDVRALQTPSRERRNQLLPPGGTSEIQMLGLNRSTVQSRLRRGWTYRDAITTPVETKHASRK